MKNIEKLLQSRLLDLLLFHIKGYHKQFRKFSKINLAKPLNACERIVFNKFQVSSLLTTSVIKANYLKNFAYLLGTAILTKTPLCLQRRTISIAYAISSQRLFVPSFIMLGVVLERGLVESSCSEAFDKIREAINNVLI